VPWILVAAVGLARIYLGAHNPLDVVGGAAVGLVLGGLLNLAFGVPVDAPASERTTTESATRRPRTSSG
jgi:membrane-associated phospholipid phosphatase